MSSLLIIESAQSKSVTLTEVKNLHLLDDTRLINILDVCVLEKKNKPQKNPPQNQKQTGNRAQMI